MQKKRSRRHFLITTTLAAAGYYALGNTGCKQRSNVPEHLGVQLYSVRDDMQKDPVNTLEALAKMGYREVEAYGYDEGKLFGYAYPEFGKLLKNNGLQMPSTHAGISLAVYDEAKDDISDPVKKWIDAAPALGLKYLISPSINTDEWPQMDKVVKLYAAMGRYCKKAGVRFAHHNHEYEYQQKAPDGRLLIEWILQEVDPALMAMQMDLCWVVYAKNNPVDWFKKYPGRWELCHAKDLATNGERETAIVGEGSLDFKTIFKNRESAGLQYFMVELEHYKSTPLEGVKTARQNLINMF
ncbi:MAG: sugar phosphate isomerase/epimerase [Lewinellaceae bacterium]|nr:sugar phosphate isomerase/epimerase [Saprospiraceae bacterium]MCB9333801.1 sugar phosphate isomerase/epimerase [Lewinellaceae bacterium]